MNRFGSTAVRRFGYLGALLLLLFSWHSIHSSHPVYAAGGIPEGDSLRVLAPIHSGNLLLFPVVRSGKLPESSPFLTLDEGIRSGQVEVTEAGRVRGLVRPRPHDGNPHILPLPNRGDAVNTLVLVNNSKKPLLLLAGEIVTGGKQDRVIAKDRIVPPNADPVDLGVFCIEPGRWTEASATFGASANAPAASIMVQPSVREKAMVAKNQQQVWDSVHGTLQSMAMAASPRPGPTYSGPVAGPINLGTTSYAKAMQDDKVANKVNEAVAPVMQSREEVLAQLRQEHAVGVVVAVRGEIIWADIFSDPELLSRYWTKLVRSYAAESLLEGGAIHNGTTVADAQHFLDAPRGGTEVSEGDVGVYRYRELHSGGSETFVLESLLPGTGYDVHISKVKMSGDQASSMRKYHGVEPVTVIR